MMRAMIRAYSISAADIVAEKERVKGDLSKFEFGAVIKLDQLELREVGRSDVHLRILAASGEHNVDHAVLADTDTIAAARGGKIYPGNSAVGEILAVGGEVKRFKPGDIVLTHCNGQPDSYGYPMRIWAYDQPESIGWYSEEAVVGDWQLVHAPLDCGLSLWEMAALPLRAPTAFHMWRRALGIFRLKVAETKLRRLNVLSFGGGVGECFLMLAKAEGHHAYFCSGTPERRAALERQGIHGIDQRLFNRFASRDDVRAFQAEVRKLTDSVSMHIVCDMLRGPVFQAGIAALARCGVNVSSGWQLDKKLSYDSAGLSVRQITLDHMHYETIDGCNAATTLYGSIFKPTVHSEIYRFEDLPRCFDELKRNLQTGIPIVQVARELPAAVRSLIPT